jgi:hypothetical protein
MLEANVLEFWLAGEGLRSAVPVVMAVLLGRLGYSLPLVVAISLVYAATRHEATRPILEHAARFAFWVLAFMVLVYLVMAVTRFWL